MATFSTVCSFSVVYCLKEQNTNTWKKNVRIWQTWSIVTFVKQFFASSYLFCFKESLHCGVLDFWWMHHQRTSCKIFTVPFPWQSPDPVERRLLHCQPSCCTFLNISPLWLKLFQPLQVFVHELKLQRTYIFWYFIPTLFNTIQYCTRIGCSPFLEYAMKWSWEEPRNEAIL